MYYPCHRGYFNDWGVEELQREIGDTHQQLSNAPARFMSQSGDCCLRRDEYVEGGRVVDSRSQLQYRQSRSRLRRIPKAEKTLRVGLRQAHEWGPERERQDQVRARTGFERPDGPTIRVNESSAGELAKDSLSTWAGTSESWESHGLWSTSTSNGASGHSINDTNDTGTDDEHGNDGDSTPAVSATKCATDNNATTYGTAHGAAATDTADCHIRRLQPCQNGRAANDLPCKLEVQSVKSPPCQVIDESTGRIRCVSPTSRHDPATGTAAFAPLGYVVIKNTNDYRRVYP